MCGCWRLAVVLDLAQEALGADHGRELRPEHLERDGPVVAQVVRAVHGRHPARPDGALDRVAPCQGAGDGVEVCGHEASGAGRCRADGGQPPGCMLAPGGDRPQHHQVPTGTSAADPRRAGTGTGAPRCRPLTVVSPASSALRASFDLRGGVLGSDRTSWEVACGSTPGQDPQVIHGLGRQRSNVDLQAVYPRPECTKARRGLPRVGSCFLPIGTAGLSCGGR